MAIISCGVSASLLADEGVKTKDGGVPLFAQWACKDSCGEQKGKALSGATIGSVVANPSLSTRSQFKTDDLGYPFFFPSPPEFFSEPLFLKNKYFLISEI